jgi:hypothetical protein
MIKKITLALLVAFPVLQSLAQAPDELGLNDLLAWHACEASFLGGSDELLLRGTRIKKALHHFLRNLGGFLSWGGMKPKEGWKKKEGAFHGRR